MMVHLCRGAWPAHRAAACALCSVAVIAAACAPVLDWRDVRPAGSGMQLQFPCRPSMQERRVALAGPAVPLMLYACNAGGQTWGLGYADLADLARVAAALAELRVAAAANIAAPAGEPLPLQVAGATPHARSMRLRLAGQLPDGAAVQMQLAVFTRGTQVFQATVLGERLAEDAAAIFFESIRFQAAAGR